MCKSIFQLFCNLLCPVLLTIGYWALLYKTSWAYGVAIASIVYFGIGLIANAIFVAIGFCALCCAGFVFAFGDQPIATSAIIVFVVIFAVLVIIFQFGISLAGLLLSIDLLNSGGQTCPVDGVDCRWLIILVFLTLFFNSFRSVNSKQDQNVLNNYERVEVTGDGPTSTRVTEVSQNGYVTTTTQTTEGGQTQTTTVTRPLNEDGTYLPDAKTIFSTLLLSPQTALNFRRMESTARPAIDVESGSPPQH